MERFAKIYDFNSHAHVERDLPFYVALQLELYFNSHAHVERDVYNLCKLSIYTISTHTLTWSVTRSFVNIYPFHAISTHTLTWSVTVFLTLISLKYFISTHTLTWSVTFIWRSPALTR